MSNRIPGRAGFPWGPRRSSVSARRLRGTSDCRPPDAGAAGFILPRASCPLQSATIYCLLPVNGNDAISRSTSKTPEAPPLGFSSPHRDISQRRPHTRRESHPRASVRPRRFSRPRRFTPPLALRVCFTPQPRPGFALQGFVPHHGADPGFPEPTALVPLSTACLWFDPGRPTTPSTSGPCSPRRMRWLSKPVKASTTPRPSWACASTGDSPRTPWQRFHAAFACTLHRDEPTAAESWRLAGARSGWSGIRLPTRARFLA
jgi:hypothetical protein